MRDESLTVRGEVVGYGTETLPDGTTRKYAKVKVKSVVDKPSGGPNAVRITFTTRDDTERG